MATARPFAYNSGGLIPGTEQIGNIAVGYPTNGFGSTGLDWWNGPDEETGYVVCGSLAINNQSTQVPEDAIVISSTYKGVNINLSNNNQTAFQQFGYQMSGLGENLISGTDKVMFSIYYTTLTPLTLPQSRFIGVGKTTMNYQGSPYGGYPGNDTNSIGFSAIGDYYYNGSVVSTGLPTWGDGDIIDIVISHGQYWWIRVNGGYWNNNPSADPASLSSGLTMNGQTNYYPALCPGYEGTMTILNYPSYGVPSGYNFLGNKTAQIGFFRTDVLSDNAFIDMVSNISSQNFNTTTECTNWLNTNGYWTSYGAFSSSITIPTNDSSGLNGWSNGALSVAYNPTLISEYPVGSTIVFQDGSTAIIIGYDSYAPNYIDIFWDTPKSGTLFPITIGVSTTTTTTTTAAPTTTTTTTAPPSGSGSWYFYANEGELTVGPPTTDGQAIFTDNLPNGSTNVTFNPNKSGGVNFLNFNLQDSAGTDYTTQFTNLQTNGGTVSVIQNGIIATYTLSVGMAFIQSGPGFVAINTADSTQTVTATSNFVYADPISISFS